MNQCVLFLIGQCPKHTVSFIFNNFDVFYSISARNNNTPQKLFWNVDMCLYFSKHFIILFSLLTSFEETYAI